MDYENIKFNPELLYSRFKAFNKSKEDQLTQEEIYNFLDSNVSLFIYFECYS